LPKVSKGIPQNDFELPSAFFGTKQSSTRTQSLYKCSSVFSAFLLISILVGLALCKAESEGRDYQARMARGQIQVDKKH
jgi:hypothetical protein